MKEPHNYVKTNLIVGIVIAVIAVIIHIIKNLRLLF